jgi:hypothetical protein
MLGSGHPAPFMTFTFEVCRRVEGTRVPEVVHEDGTSRAQVLKREYNPRYYDLMLELEKLTGNGVVPQHLAQPARRTDDLLTDRCAQHVLRLGPGVSGDGGCPGGQGRRGPL